MSANDESPDSEVQVPGAMPGDVTRLLRAARGGDEGARDRVYDLVYGQLRDVAATSMRRESRGHTLQPTALVHEAFLKLTRYEDADWQDRSHFLATAARAMRQILVDHARTRTALKRGGRTLRHTLDEAREGLLAARRGAEDEILSVNAALERLEALDPAKSRVVELRFFGGLSVEESARVMGVSERTVKRLWQHARAWLYREMQE